MPLFLLGLLLGGISGGVTYGLTTDSGVAVIFGAIAAALTWFGLATVIFGDD